MLSIGLTGCKTTRPTRVGIVESVDFFRVPAGSKVVTDTKAVTTNDDGYFISDEVLTDKLRMKCEE